MKVIIVVVMSMMIIVFVKIDKILWIGMMVLYVFVVVFETKVVGYMWGV